MVGVGLLFFGAEGLRTPPGLGRSIRGRTDDDRRPTDLVVLASTADVALYLDFGPPSMARRCVPPPSTATARA